MFVSEWNISKHSINFFSFILLQYNDTSPAETEKVVKAFKVLLTYTIEDLDLGYVYLTEGTIKLVGQRCPNLKVLNLRECGYVVTDHMLEMLLKVSKTKQLCFL